LIGTYAQLVQGGAIHGLNRELPYSMGQQDSTTVLELAGTGRVLALVAVGLCLLGIPLGWMAFSSNLERLGMAAVLLGTSAQIYRLYLGATYRAARSFEVLAKIQVVEAGLAVLTLPLVLLWGFSGLAARFVLLMLGGTYLNHLFRPLKDVGSFRWRRVKELLATGIPIFAFGYLSDVARSLPRLILLSLGGVTWVGLFAPASAVVGALGMIPGAVGAYIYPQMTHRLGRTGDPASLWPMARATALWSLAAGVPVALVFVAVLPYLIAHFFPAYTASIPATQWVVGTGVFMGGSVAVNALASLKAFRSMFAFAASRLMLLLVLPWVGERIVGGLTGVAAGMTVAYGLDFIVALSLTHLATRAPAVA
jgi:O-antigen/teichoic acid export membrane protein